jgi:hypothetical protein
MTLAMATFLALWFPFIIESAALGMMAMLLAALSFEHLRPVPRQWSSQSVVSCSKLRGA